MFETLSGKKKKQIPKRCDDTFKLRLKYIMVASLQIASLETQFLQTWGVGGGGETQTALFPTHSCQPRAICFSKTAMFFSSTYPFPSFFCGDRISLYSPSWFQTCNPPASVPGVQGLQAYCHHADKMNFAFSFSSASLLFRKNSAQLAANMLSEGQNIFMEHQ